ncbi:lymphoid-specific helicase [Solenopsis invicta]|uniref:lymphoid-specific helicase n=1 Tax=Solenopsis invicta TaxID=13686 RepID=UPI00193CA0C3|nr:lymphoid-specific helicase [Solenopsis invicta]
MEQATPKAIHCYDSNTIYPENNNCSSFLADDTLIAPSDVKFKDSPLYEKKISKKRNVNLEAKLEKQLEEAEYIKEANNRRYKQLMHLVNMSKFYSSYLLKKIEDDKNKKNKTTSKRKSKKAIGHPLVNNENIPPSKRLKGVNKENYSIQKHTSTEIKKQAQITEKKILNEDEIEVELSADSDTEVDLKVIAETNTDFIKPKYFCGELYNYQKIGLEWLKRLYDNALNGILADEMGLGKTVQVISLICHLIEKKQPGPYLIIAPLSTLPNWIAEFERFAPAIPIVFFYGSKEEREQNLYKKIKQKYHVANEYWTQPVVLTTYEVPLNEANFLRTQHWRYIVVDEGQRIKNYNCQLIKVLKNLRSVNRLILTGTPLQNDLTELWSLLNFLNPEIFDNLDTFESWFDVNELQHQDGTEKVLKQEEEKQVLLSLREILKPFMLRRLKIDVCKEIPPKKELIVYAPLTELQHDLYQAVLNYDIEMLCKIEKEEEILDVDGVRPKRQCVLRQYQKKYGENKASNASLQEIENNNDWKLTASKASEIMKWKQYADITDRNRDFFIEVKTQNRFMLYKRIVNHPHLVHCPLDDVGLPKVDDDLIKSSGKLLVLDAMLAKLKVQGHKVLLFSTMTMILDLIEDYLTLRDYNYVRLDGSTAIETRKKNINKFNNDPDTFLFLISTRSGGVGLNLMSADTVIIYDSDWNPQADIQAMARCHRIGQTKPVVVYRLCTRGTIDEAIIKRAEGKRILEKMVISKELKNLTRETLSELKKLMESKEYKVVRSEKEVFTEMELNKLLDRSDMIINNNDNLQG